MISCVIPHQEIFRANVYERNENLAQIMSKFIVRKSGLILSCVRKSVQIYTRQKWNQILRGENEIEICGVEMKTDFVTQNYYKIRNSS